MFYNKYHAKKTKVGNITFDSKKEAKRYNELGLLLKAKKIKHLQLQVPFILIPKNENGRAIKYIADFVYFDEQDKVIVEDVKGVKTPVYNLKKRLLKEKFGIDIVEV